MCWPQHADHGASAAAAARSARRRRVHRCGRRSPDRITATRMSSAPLRGREYVRHLVRIARELADIAGRVAPAVRRDHEGRRPCWPDDCRQPRAGRAARAAAGDRRRTSAAARHPDRRGRATPTPSWWRANCWPGPTRTRPPGATASGTPRACAPLRCAPRAANHRRRPRARRHAPAASARPVTCKPWSSSRSTGFRRGRDRSRSRSARPASTSPTSWSPSAVPQLRGPAAAAGHRLRRRGDRGRAGRHRSPGR